MGSFVWLFPLLFLVHELEELFGFEKWFHKNKDKFSGRPREILDYVSTYFSKKAMLFAITEQLVLSVIVCFISLKYDFFNLWLGAFIAYTVHLIVHVGQSLAISSYIPAVFTSVLEIPVCLFIVYKVYTMFFYSLMNIICYSLLSLIIIGLNLLLLHRVMIKINS